MTGNSISFDSRGCSDIHSPAPIVGCNVGTVGAYVGKLGAGDGALVGIVGDVVGIVGDLVGTVGACVGMSPNLFKQYICPVFPWW
jgi:hypothetical protein